MLCCSFQSLFIVGGLRGYLWTFWNYLKCHEERLHTCQLHRGISMSVLYKSDGEMSEIIQTTTIYHNPNNHLSNMRATLITSLSTQFKYVLFTNVNGNMRVLYYSLCQTNVQRDATHTIKSGRKLKHTLRGN